MSAEDDDPVACGVSWQAVGAGLVAACVGFGSSFAVVLKGLVGVGASPSEAASGLFALSVGMGSCAVFLALRLRMPVSIAWSTPGAALLAASAVPEGGFPAAIGAFLASAGLIVLAGLWRPLGRAVASIPSPLANAMLAGVLLPLCLAPVRAMLEAPAAASAVIIVWALVARINRLFAVPAAALVALLILMRPGSDTFADAALFASPVFVTPTFSISAIVGIALPLFIVTMASQNIPGYAVMNANGYKPDFNALLRGTGIFSLFAAPFGAHGVNLAAITAALCASPEAEPDPGRRWQAAVAAGLAYVAFGVAAGGAAAMMIGSGPIIVEAVAGLALLSSLATALQAGTADSDRREAAIVTFVVAASGVSLFGIGGAFWGLVAGGAVLLLDRIRGQFTRK
jgi:benzoate membrane transport protein